MALGRGLESLIPQKKQPEADQTPVTGHQKENIFYIEIDKIKPNPHQPRRDFNEEELGALARSIAEHGILQPLVVTKEEIEHAAGRRSEYHIVAGERRLRAAKLAGFSQVPVIIREATEQTKLELALIENIQRQDLNSIEEARAYQKLANDFSLTQERIAERVGKSRELVANKLRLLNLPHEVQTMLASNSLTEGHAKVLLSLRNPEKQIYLAGQTAGQRWSVRELERKVKAELEPKPALTQVAPADPELEALKRTIAETLGTNVSIQGSGEKGRLAIEFYSKEELRRIIEKLTGGGA